MKYKYILKRFVCSALTVLGVTSASFAQKESSMVLLGGTDFEPIVPAVGKPYIGTNEIKMTGLLGGTLNLYGTQPSEVYDLGYDYSKATANRGEAIASHFHDGEFMAITGNPIHLGFLHYIDDDSDNWGVLWSRIKGGKGVLNKNILNYTLDGIQPGSDVKVVIKYRSVIDPDAVGYADLACQMSGHQLVAFKVAANMDEANKFLGKDAKQVAHGVENEYVETVKASAEGSFYVNVNMTSQYMNNDCSSLQITSIKVYGSFVPEIFSEDGNSICAGEFANVKLKGDYPGCTYQWIVNGTSVPGATSPKYVFETASSEENYNLQLRVTSDGVSFVSNNLVLSTKKCCEIMTTDNGPMPASRKVVFKEDFGEFDLSDPTGKTYKVWDYTDIANPEQITKNTTTPFRYELDEAPLGCDFRGEGPIEDGEYTVAGVLTGYNGAYKGMVGAKLEWAADLHGVKLNSGIHFDHSGTPEGCCLLINCKDKTGGQNIYEREITNLCQNRQLFFECYISIFTSSAAGKYNPVDVTVRLTEIGNPSNVVEERATQTLPADSGTGDWVKINGQIFLERGDGIKLEIVNNMNTCQNGNDLVLDDIIIRACAAPSLQAYFDINTFETDTITCDNSDDKIMVYAKPSDMLTNYFGGVDNVRYLYQWTLTPKDKRSWKRISDPTKDLKMKAGTDAFAGVVTGDKVYFRAIAASDYTLSITDDKDFNADDPCASYTISDPIECEILCSECTTPKENIKIKVSDGRMSDGKKNGKDIYNLCYGESITLEQAADITPDKLESESPDFAGFAIEWFENEKPGSITNAKIVMNGVIAPKVVNYDDETLSGSVMPVVLYAVDATYPDGTCKTADTVYIKYNPIVDATFSKSSFEFGEGNGAGKVDMTLTNGKTEDYMISWWSGADTVGATSLEADMTATFFEGLKARL